MEKDYEKLFAVKYVLQKEGLENFRRNRNRYHKIWSIH